MENTSNSKNSILPLVLAGILCVLIMLSNYISYPVAGLVLRLARGIMLVLSFVFVYKQKTLSIITSIIAFLLSVAILILRGDYAESLHELYIASLIVLLLVYAIRPSETKKWLFPILAFGMLIIVSIVQILLLSSFWGWIWQDYWFIPSYCYALFTFALSQTQSMALTEVPTKTHAINATKTLSSLETLEKLAGLKQQGILSNEDYEKKKQEIMRQF